MYFYNARYYDGYLNRFISPDSIIPDPKNPQDLNRYSYTRNNPLRYTDPTGHLTKEQIEQWTGYTEADLDPAMWNFLLGLILGDQIWLGSTDIYHLTLDGGTLRFDSGSGRSAYNLTDMMALKGLNPTASLEGTGRLTVRRGIVVGSQRLVYDSDKGGFLEGWGPAIDNHTTTISGRGRFGVVAGVSIISGLAGAGAACAYGALFTAGAACAVSVPVGLATSIVAGVAVGWVTDPVVGTSGAQQGDILYSYRFDNGETYTTVVNSGGTFTKQRSGFVTSEVEGILWALTTSIGEIVNGY